MQSDEGSKTERVAEVLTLQRGEGSDATTFFSEADQVSKPLVAFEDPPLATAPPVTWGSRKSRSTD
jgi:hypothetical protein